MGTVQRPLQWSRDITCRNPGITGREGKGGEERAALEDIWEVKYDMV